VNSVLVNRRTAGSVRPPMRSFAAGLFLAALLALLPRSDAQVPPAIDDDDLILLIIAANKAPGAAFTSPSNNAQFSASGPGANIPLTVSATDFEGKIAKVEIFRGATSIKTFAPTSGFLAPGSFSHTDTGQPQGSYVYKVVVTDQLNKKAEATVSVTVTANTPPSIAAIGPTTLSANINTSVSLQVNATDTVGQTVTVQFFDALTGALIGNGSPSGNTFTLNWSANTEGVHSIRAVASDGLDQASTTFTVAVMRLPAATGVYSPKATSTVGSIAGTFAVSESGAATYSIPIPVPPGAAGMQPSLALSYSSQGGAGPLGLGWGVSGVSTIARCPMTVATNGQRNGINYDADITNDAYCLDGQRLVAVTNPQTTGTQSCDAEDSRPIQVQEYRTEVESYAKVIAYSDNPCVVTGPSRFEVHTKSGQVMHFGLFPNDRYGDGDWGAWVVSWPTSVSQPSTNRPNTVKVWPLVRTIDRAGNFIRYQYCGTNVFVHPLAVINCNEAPPGGTAGDVPPVGAFPPTEHHLKRVRYGGRINPTAISSSPLTYQVVSAPIARADFIYGLRAVDQQRMFDSGGGETTLTKELKSVATSVDGIYAQTYVFTYGTSGWTDRRRLASVQQCAGLNQSASPFTSACLAPTVFSYTAGPANPNLFALGTAVGGNQLDANAAGDLDGDGKTDLIYVPDNTSLVRVALSSNNYVWADRNLGMWESVSRGSERYLADFNGDGKADLVLRASDGTFRFCDLRLGTSATTADCKNPLMAAAAENFYLQGDFDGDGRIDFLLFRGMVNNVYSWDLHLGDSATGVKPAIAINYLPNTFSPSALHKHFAVGDFNGDGRADLIFRKASSVCNVPREPSDTYKCQNQGVAWNVCFSRPGATAGSIQFNCGGEVAAGNGLLEKSIAIDFNGDGLADLAYPAFPEGVPAGSPAGSETHWNICLSAGDGSFVRPNAAPPTPPEVYSPASLCKTVPIFQATPDNMVFGDFDGDGKSDMARHVSGNTWRVCLARTDDLTQSPNHVKFACADWSGAMNPNGSVSGNILSGDFNGDGKTDLFSYRNAPFQMALAPIGMPDMLQGVQNGLGATTQISYLPLTDSTVYSKTGATAGADEIVIQSPLYVVRSTQESNGIGGTFDHLYGYTCLKGATNGRGLLGFFTRTVVDSSGLRRTTEYNQIASEWWKAGRPSRAQTVSSAATGNVVLSDAKNEWQLLPHNGWPQVYRVQLASTLEAKRDLDNTALPCSRMTLYDPLITTTPQVDVYGNVLVTATETGTSCNLDTGSFTPDGFKKVTTNTYAPVNPADWQIGRLASASVQHMAPGKSAVTRTSAFTYHNVSGGWCGGASAPYANLCSEVVEPNETDMRLETRYEYDEWGNVATTRRYFQEGLDTVERRTTLTFGPNGRFAQRIAKKNVRAATEAGEHVETRAYDVRTGGVTLVRNYFGMDENDQRSIITTTYLDDFGRVVGERTTSDDTNKLTETDITWGAENLVGTAAIYSVWTRTHTGAQTKVYYDALQREVARDIRGFVDPQITRILTTYDSRGRKSSVTKPAGNSTMTTSWSYDEIDRATSEITSGNGITSTVTTTPKGLVSVTRRTNGTYHDQKTIAQRDSQGQITLVMECLADINQVASENDDATCTAPRRTLTTTYGYDATGNLISVRTPPTPTNLAGLERTAEFDKRGRKKWTIDPDEGRTDLVYNGIGELIERRYQQSASQQFKTTMTYDDLGRLYIEKTVNTAPAGISAFERRFDYDVCGAQPRVNGRLCSTTLLRDQTHFLVEHHYADRYGRTYRSSRVDGGAQDDTFKLFDSQGRPSQLIHPNLQGFLYEYVDNGSGALRRIRDARNSSIVHWQADSRFDDGQIQSMTVGGVSVANTYDGFGRPQTISAQNGLLQQASYSFDAAGNLRSRADGPNGLSSESFNYDSLHRVISGGGVTMTYDDAGNIASRNGISYDYHTGSNRLRNGGAYTFDDAGNLKTGAGGLIAAWTAENLPLSITKGAHTVSWLYDVDRKRYKEVSTATGTTTYFAGMERVEAPDGTIRYKHMISTPEGVVGMAEWIVANGATTSDRRYWLRDHLGSTVGTFNAVGVRQETFGYSVWGERTAPVTVNPSYTQRGFTGHEMLDEIGLVHMNGRIYDPAIGRFLSPDPIIEAPYNGQSWNRYSYVFNNPLSGTDPTGYSSWWVDWRRPIGAIAAAALLRFEVMPALLAESGLATSSVVAISNTVAGFAAGGIMGGNVHSALQGAFFANLNFGIGEVTGHELAFFTKEHLLNTALHGLVGCGQQSAAGGNCRAGAISGSFSALAAPVNEVGLPGQIVIGAIASRLAGDRAQNGAITAAFEYLFNAMGARVLRGTGHHIVRNATARDLSFSKEALVVLDGPENRIPVQGHNAARPCTGCPSHAEYNKAERKFVEKYLKDNKIDPQKMTKDQASKLVQAVKSANDPVIRQFNRGQYMRALTQAMRRIHADHPQTRAKADR
jgi:RHS repeat-associated protein